ncbi:YchJ family protein [Sulfurospirillum sp. 1612]|uniref:YchJ family protein n=1 Tax=Sulfurospirillum sp. 1612 TaxID=3094835 RepID=UPI002F9352E3
MVNKPCPCGSHIKYKKCCRPFHEGKVAKDALTLMKSRYSAYANHHYKYIMSTTHQDHDDSKKDPKIWQAEIEDFCAHTQFQKLQILEFIEGQTEAYVTFRASLLSDSNDVSFTEKSRFLKENNRWYYVSGDIL